MSMSDEVAGATLQVSMHATEKVVDIGAKAFNDLMDTIAKLLQSLSANRGGAGIGGKGKDKVTKTDLTDIKPGAVKIKDLIANARKNGDSIATSDHGLTAADKKYITKKAKEYGIPVAFTGDKGKDNLYATVRKNDLPILERICTDMMKDKLAERPQELGNFKVQEWEVPFITAELNKHDLSAQFGKTESDEHFCLYEKADEKAILIARGEFVRKSEEVKKDLAMDKDENGYLTIKDIRSGKEISFEADAIPSREELSAQIQEQFGYDKNKADIACAKFGEEQLQGADKKKFFSSDPQQAFSKVDTNINLEGESILVKPYTCWRVTPKKDSIPRIVYQDESGHFAVLNPEKQTKATMRKTLEEHLHITDKETLDALVDKAAKVTDYYEVQNEQNMADVREFDEAELLTKYTGDLNMHVDEESNVHQSIPQTVATSIEREDKKHFSVTSSMQGTEYTHKFNGDTETKPISDQRTLVLSFSDKKNAIAELTELYRQQGVPAAMAVSIAKDVFAKAQEQSPEKVLHIEEIRAETPTNPTAANTPTEVFMTVTFGNKAEEINITDREKAIAEVCEKFNMGEDGAAALLDKAAEELNDNAEHQEQAEMPDVNEREHMPDPETVKLEELDAPKEEKPVMEEVTVPEIGNGHESHVPDISEAPEIPVRRGRH